MLERPVDGAEEPAQAWVDLTGEVAGRPAGLTVIANGKHGWDASPGESASIGITAVRSPVYSWHDPRLLDPDGIYSFQDQGIQRFSYELVPHAGDYRAAQPARRAAELGSPVRAMLESFHPGELPSSLQLRGRRRLRRHGDGDQGERGRLRRSGRRGPHHPRGRDPRRTRPMP